MALQNLGRSSVANVSRICSLLGGVHVGPNLKQRRTLTAGEKPQRPQPWNYDLLGYHSWYAYLDDTRSRLNDHSKYIVVEGLPACGKNALARKLAQTFDLAYFPDFDEHDIFRMEETVDGQADYREYNEILPRSMLYYDRQLLFLDDNPAKHGKPIKLQRDILVERVKRYWSAMAYLFNTGQGVITMRSPLSDHVFADALMKLNLCRADSHDFYTDYAHKATRETVRPHMVLYCHMPTEAIRERLQKSPLGYESSKHSLLNDKFLKQLDASYREFVDKRYRQYAEVVEVDMTSLLYPKRPRGDAKAAQQTGRVVESIADSLEYDFLVEDLEALDLSEKRSLDNEKRFDDWINIFRNRDTLNMARWKFTNLGLLYRVLSMEPTENYDEFLMQPDHQKIFASIQKRDPRFKNGYPPRWDPQTVGLLQTMLRFDLKNWLRSATLHVNILPVEFEKFGNFYLPENSQLKKLVDSIDSRWFLPDRRSVDPLTLLSGKQAPKLKSLSA